MCWSLPVELACGLPGAPSFAGRLNWVNEVIISLVRDEESPHVFLLIIHIILA